MEFKPKGSVTHRAGPPSYFTGTVRVGMLSEPAEPARVRVGYVTFEPGARTAWHTHPLGQTLYIVSGTGCVQSWGGPVIEVGEGDTVWFPPGEKHWHGASPGAAMTHLAIQEALDGRTADWMEHVTDAQYAAKPGSA